MRTPECWTAIDAELQGALRLLAERINRSPADFVMPLARKAMCIVDILAREGLVVAKSILSDRVIDSDLSWVANKRILIVDDVLISGSSLRRLTDRLVTHGATVTTSVLVVDADYLNDDYFAPDHAELILPHTEAMGVSRDLVDFIAVYPRPYNVDWPLFNSTARSRTHARRLLTLPQYLAYDVTSSKQRVSKIKNVTFEPADFTVDQLSARTGIEIRRIASIVKLRMLLDSRTRSVRLILMPIVVLSGIHVDDLENIFKATAQQASRSRLASGERFNHSVSPEYMLRAVQFTLARELGEIFCSDSNEAGIALNWNLDRRQIDYLFPPSDAKLFGRRLEPNPNSKLLSPTFDSELAVSERQLPLKPKTPGRINLIQAQLTFPFVLRNKALEQRARMILKDGGEEDFADPKNQRYANRLMNGIAYRELLDLAKRAQPEMPLPELRLAVSVFIDLATDAGISVPITERRGNYVFRTYRHGEDVLFGETEMQLCWMLLDALASAWGRDNLPKVAVEKMIVLLLRIGIHQSIFSPWEGALGQSGSLGIRYRLHGAVAYTASASLFNTLEGQPLSEVLRSNGLLREIRGYYHLGDPHPGTPVRKQTEAEVRTIGALFGSLLRPTPTELGTGYKPTLVAEDLTILASCTKHADLLKAMAAEIHIAAIVDSRPLEQTIRFGLSQSYSEIERRLTRSKFYIAINSAAMKYRRFESDYSAAIDSKVHKEVDDVLRIHVWESYYDALVDRSHARKNAETEDLTRALATWIFLCNILSRAALVSLLTQQLRGKHDRVVQKNRSKYGAQIEEFLTHLDDVTGKSKPGFPLGSEILQVIDQVFDDDTDQTSSLPQVGKLFRMLVDSAETLLDEVNARTSTDGVLRDCKKFEHALIVRLGKTTYNSESLFRQMYSYVQAALWSGHSSFEQCSVLPHRMISDCVVILGPNAQLSSLVQLAAMVFSQFAKRCNPTIFLAAGVGRHSPLFAGEVSAEWYGERFLHSLRLLSKLEVGTVGGEAAIFSLCAPSDTIHNLNPVRMLSSTGASVIFTPLTSSATTDVGLEHLEYEMSFASSSADIGVVTVLPCEARAVIKLLEKNESFQEAWDDTNLRAFYLGSIGSAEMSCSVVMTQCVDPKALSAAEALRALIRNHNPSIVVLLGIAGGVSGDLSIGDVVIANQVIAYDSRKETSHGVAYRGEAWKISASMRNALNSFFAREPDPEAYGYKVMLGPVGTGGAVLGYKESGIRDMLIGYNSKVLAVETEAEGVEQHLYEEEELSTRPVVVLRGISDKADEEKDDNSHVIASERAAEVLERTIPWLKRFVLRSPG